MFDGIRKMCSVQVVSVYAQCSHGHAVESMCKYIYIYTRARNTRAPGTRGIWSTSTSSRAKPHICPANKPVNNTSVGIILRHMQ